MEKRLKWLNRIKKISHRSLGMGIGSMFLLGFLFFNNIFGALMVSICGIWVGEMIDESNNKKKLSIKKIQFMDGIYALSASMSVGKSLESSFAPAIKDLTVLYEVESFIIQSLKKIEQKLINNVPIEEALFQFSKESQMEEVEIFCEMIGIGKKTGCDLNQLVLSTVTKIQEKMDLQKELEVITTQKRFELYLLMLLMPAIVLYMSTLSASFNQIMYATVVGKMVMGICLGIYGISYIIGSKIVDIHI